jgi:aspartate/methionine/tyrosine aminotransferase
VRFFKNIEGEFVGVVGEGFVRFSYANSLENITIAMDRLENYLSQISQNSD